MAEVSHNKSSSFCFLQQKQNMRLLCTSEYLNWDSWTVSSFSPNFQLSANNIMSLQDSFPLPKIRKKPALQTKHLGFNLEIILGNLSWIHFPNVLSEKLQPDGAQESSAPLCSFQLWYNLSPTAKELFSGCFLPQPLPAPPWRHSSVMQTALGKRFL